MRDMEIDPAFYSTRDPIGVLLDNPESAVVLGELLGSFAGQKKSGGATAGAGGMMGMLKNMFGNSTIDKLLGMMGTMTGTNMTDEEMQKVMNYANTKLQKIRKA